MERISVTTEENGIPQGVIGMFSYISAECLANEMPLAIHSSLPESLALESEACRELSKEWELQAAAKCIEQSSLLSFSKMVSTDANPEIATKRDKFGMETTICAVLKTEDTVALAMGEAVHSALLLRRNDGTFFTEFVKDDNCPAFRIADWVWLHQCLHTGAYYLNPQFHYNKDFCIDNEVKIDLYVCIDKLVPEGDYLKTKNDQLENFHLKNETFRFIVAKTCYKTCPPKRLWAQFGDDVSELKAFAVKVLSLNYSVSTYKRNYSTFNQIHTKRINRLTAELYFLISRLMPRFASRLMPRLAKTKRLYSPFRLFKH
ncbi:hypothetical protein M5K25_011216 [Dendrobium thyrsiflorum]|uniref:Uncharacterized protein n=1 Tax=Dendrobium thyrsiflorum TaxID=117978 RepID=A0ABD0V2H1_DENTH